MVLAAGCAGVTCYIVCAGWLLLFDPRLCLLFEIVLQNASVTCVSWMRKGRQKWSLFMTPAEQCPDKLLVTLSPF